MVETIVIASGAANIANVPEIAPPVPATMHTPMTYRTPDPVT